MNERYPALRPKYLMMLALMLGVNSPELGASVPHFAGMSALEKQNFCMAIGDRVADFNGIRKLIDGYVFGKNYDPNRKVIAGNQFPLIFLAACLSDASILRKLIDEFVDNPLEFVSGKGAKPQDQSKSNEVSAFPQAKIENFTTSDGDTLLHIATKNSIACLKLLLKDGRLDINQRNHDEKTPLYLAMEYAQKKAVGLLLNDPRIDVNSKGRYGRTMLHMAVINGNVEVVKQLLALSGSYGTGVDGNKEPQSLDRLVTDDFGRTPGEYIKDVRNFTAKTKITILFQNAGVAIVP